MKLAACNQIAFYGSTPAYREVLDSIGYGDLQPELNRLSKAGEWERMGTLISDDMLEAFAIVAPPDEVGPRLAERYGELLDRVTCTFVGASPQQQKDLIAFLHAN